MRLRLCSKHEYFGFGFWLLAYISLVGCVSKTVEVMDRVGDKRERLRSAVNEVAVCCCWRI